MLHRSSIIICALLALVPAVVSAQDPEGGLATPRRTVETFLDAVYDAQKGDDFEMAAAMACLDLSGITAMREEVGRQRVRQLKIIFDRINMVGQDRSYIPDTPDGGVKVQEGEAPRYRLYQDPGAEGELEMVRLNGEWKFSEYTVQLAIPDIAKAIIQRKAAEEVVQHLEEAERRKRQASEQRFATVHQWLRAKMPESMRARAGLLEWWQWAGLGVMVILGGIVNKLSILLLLLITIALFRAQKMEVDKELTRKSLRPFGMLAMALFWWAGLGWLGLPPRALAVVAVIVKFVVAIAGVWGAYRLVDVLCDALEKKAAKSVSKFDDLLVPLIRKSSKVFIVLFGLLFVADSMGVSISGLLTGLGLGGLAFALAAQDTLKNFFGSLTVVLDRPFEVGDWVLIDKVEGSIEEVGFRSTRIRTFYQSVITIPNAKLLTAVVDNMGARRYRRWKTTIGVTYDTKPDTLEGFCEGIRELVRRAPATRKDYFQVYVVAFADSAIEIMLYVFFDCPDWTRELQEKQRMILDIMRLAEEMGVEFAFPTQTLHVAGGGGAAAIGLTPPPSVPQPEAVEPPQVSARSAGRRAVTAVMDKKRFQEALEDAEEAVEAATRSDSERRRAEAGSTQSKANEEALRAAAGQNWPTQGEVGDGEAGEGDGGGGEG